jgi:hypothetical protein
VYGDDEPVRTTVGFVELVHESGKAAKLMLAVA